MGRASYNSASLWQKVRFPKFPPLKGRKTADVCIVGGGISGLMTAYQLLMDGLDVVVLEKDSLGEGETGLTSAHLASALDDGFHRLIQEHGESGARLAYESHARAIDEIERIQQEESIECGFRRVPGFLFATTPEQEDEIQKEFKACQRLGLPGVAVVEGVPYLRGLSGSALRFEGQAQFHPLEFLKGLTERIVGLGGRISCGSQVNQLEKVSQTWKVSTDEGSVDCASVILATGVPFEDRLSMHTKEAAYRSYVSVFEWRHKDVSPALWWDTEDPYHYVRCFEKDGKCFLVVGGEDHRTGQDALAEQRFQKLEEWAQFHFGDLGAVVSRWSGQIIEPMDSLAYIGQHPGLETGAFSVSGDSGHGLTHGAIASLLFKDLVQGRPHPWKDLYSPSRRRLFGLGNFLSENAKTLAQYGDWLSMGEVRSRDEVRPDSGAVMRRGLHPVAVYREASGAIHEMSAVCPHLGGLVRWNAAEQTWDCPCHGSRFDRNGALLNGPAKEGLAARESHEEVSSDRSPRTTPRSRDLPQSETQK